MSDFLTIICVKYDRSNFFIIQMLTLNQYNRKCILAAREVLYNTFYNKGRINY